MTTGRPRRWQRLRAHHAAMLAAAGSVTCWRPTCTRTIRPGDPWDLGHRTDHALGGTNHPDNLAIECQPCNRAAGAALGNHLRWQQQTPDLAAIAP